MNDSDTTKDTGINIYLPALLGDKSESLVFTVRDANIDSVEGDYLVGTNYEHFMKWYWKLPTILKGSIYYTLKEMQNKSGQSDEEVLSSTIQIYENMQRGNNDGKID